MLQLTLAERVEAGLFLIAGLGIIAAIGAWLLDIGREEQRKPYKIRFTESISGIEKETPVLFLGVLCGEVTEVKLEDGAAPPVVVTMMINSDIQISDRTRGRIALSSIVGRLHIELDNSGDPEERLPVGPDGGWIQEKASTLTKFERAGETLAEQLVQALDNAVALTSEARQEQLFGAIDEIRLLAAELRAAIPALQGELVDTTASLRETSDVVRALILRHQEEIAEIIGATRRITDELDRFAGDGGLQSLLDDARRAIGTLEKETAQTLGKVNRWLENNDLEQRIEPYLDRTSTAIASATARLESFVARLDREGVELLRAELRPAVARLSEVGRSLVRLIALIERQPRALLFGESREERPLPKRGGSGS